jgi:nucleoside-diphosphate-sugar epimerase
VSEAFVKILVAGGAGFIGTLFNETLLEAGHDVVVLDLQDPRYRVDRVDYQRGDIRDADTVRQVMAGCDAVLNLAAAHHDWGIEKATYFDVNEHGSRVLCETMAEQGITNACFYSSVAIYGDAPEPRFEDTAPKPNNWYGASKLTGEKVYRAWADAQSGRTALIIRPTVVIGPRNYANMYSLIRQIDSGKFALFGDGKNVKSLAFVENLVGATHYLWGTGPGGSGTPRVQGFDPYNYVDKPDLTSDEIVEAIYSGFERKAPSLHFPLWFASAVGLPFDLAIKATGKNLPISTARMKKLATQTKFEADKIRSAGYAPATPLREGIIRMVRWYEREGRANRPRPIPEYGPVRGAATA